MQKKFNAAKRAGAKCVGKEIDTFAVVLNLKGYSTPKLKFSHYSLTPMSLQTRKLSSSLEHNLRYSHGYVFYVCLHIDLKENSVSLWRS